MSRHQLLPGVTTTSVPPAVRCDARAAIRSARRRAIARDILQIILLAGVNWLFFNWPEARVPLTDRATTVHLVVALNSLAIADLWLTRALPRWAAYRTSESWSRAERERFTRSLRPKRR